jgi:hypothetical protein
MNLNKTWSVLTLLTGSLIGCTNASETNNEATGTRSQPILGGEPTNDPKYAAVGAIGNRYEYDTGDGSAPIVYYDIICSATLVDAQAILTAKHCTERLTQEVAAGNSPHFLLGPSVFEPEQAIAITSWVEAPDSKKHPGLLLNGGRDVAVAYLDNAPTGVTPARVGEFEKDMLGKQFEIIGYGQAEQSYYYYGYNYEFIAPGVKFAGNATARALKGRWYELLFNGSYDDYLEWYMTDAVTGGTPTLEQAAEWWDEYNLEPGYELLAGGLPDEALSCWGDSGGPIARTGKKGLTVYGVSFAGEGSQSSVCTRGGGYLVMNEKMREFVKKALKGAPGKHDNGHDHHD